MRIQFIHSFIRAQIDGLHSYYNQKPTIQKRIVSYRIVEDTTHNNSLLQYILFPEPLRKFAIFWYPFQSWSC